MPSRTKSAAAPLYLLCCLILGGSAEGSWQNAVLELAGAAMIAWAAITRSGEAMSRQAKLLLLLVLGTALLIDLAATPWPTPSFARGMLGRISADYRLLERAAPGFPLPFPPHLSLTSLFLLLPPLAIFCVMTRLRAYRSSWLVAALLGGTIAGILLAFLQAAIAANLPPNGFGPGVRGPGRGFFESSDDMAALLLVSLPFTAAIGVSARPHLRSYTALLVLILALAAMIVVALSLTGSIAAFALSGPVLCASALVLLRPGGWRRLLLIIAGLLWLTASITVLELYGDDNALGANGYSGFSREMGLLGMIVLFLFLLWFAASIWDIWGRRRGGPFVQASSIASAALLVQSLVQFPLETAAITSCFGMCLAFLADRRLPRPQERDDLRPARHVVVG